MEYGVVYVASYTWMNNMKPYFLFTRSLAFLISVIVLGACSSESKNTALPTDNLTLFEPCEDASGLDCGGTGTIRKDETEKESMGSISRANFIVLTPNYFDYNQGYLK